MNNLENRILKGFKDNIAISNMKEECIMKKSVVRNIKLFSIVSVLCLLCSFTIVNAATGGELAANIKDAVVTYYYTITGAEVTDVQTVNVKIDWDKVDKDGTVKVNYREIENEDGTITYEVDNY